MTSLNIHRRSFLQSAGFLLGLPMFESFLHKSTAATIGETAKTLSGDPLRLAFVYAPNGVILPRWQPKPGLSLIHI